MGANDRAFRLKSEQNINIWTRAEMGEKRAKKLHKKDMSKYRRATEKREILKMR